jgi:hypothetical protein
MNRFHGQFVGVCLSQTECQCRSFPGSRIVALHAHRCSVLVLYDQAGRGALGVPFVLGVNRTFHVNLHVAEYM